MIEGTPQQSPVDMWLERMRKGDDLAWNEVLRHSRDRLARLTHKMLMDFPAVRRYEQTDDVLQRALPRLERALQALREDQPMTLREFFGLAGLQIRRELLDLVDHYYGPRGHGANHQSHDREVSGMGLPEKSDLTHEPGRLARWTEMHDHISHLPEEFRMLFELLYYQGLSKAEAALIMKVSKKTVERKWLEVRLKLQDLLSKSGPIG